MVIMMTRFFGKNKSWTEGLSITPFAILGGLAFTIPYALTGVFLGPEFPSLIGALIGLAIMTIAAKKRFLVPKDSWDFAPHAEWDKSWISKMEISLDSLINDKKPMKLWLAWTPYLLVAVILVLTRLRQLSIASFLKSFSIKWADIFGTGITGSSAPLYLPGAILCLVVIITFFLHRMSVKELGEAVKESSSILL